MVIRINKSQKFENGQKLPKNGSVNNYNIYFYMMSNASKTLILHPKYINTI